MKKLSHINDAGQVQMVDVTGKDKDRSRGKSPRPGENEKRHACAS